MQDNIELRVVRWREDDANDAERAGAEQDRLVSEGWVGHFERLFGGGYEFRIQGAGGVWLREKIYERKVV